MAEMLPSDGARSLDRRSVLRGAAAAGGTLAVGGLLAACAPQGGTPINGSPTPPNISGSVEAAKVPVGGGIVLPGENVVITQPEAGTYRAFSAICTHQGCPVSAVEKQGIKCPCHSSYFDISTGTPVAGPAKLELPTIPCRLDGELVVFGQ